MRTDFGKTGRAVNSKAKIKNVRFFSKTYTIDPFSKENSDPLEVQGSDRIKILGDYAPILDDWDDNLAYKASVEANYAPLPSKAKSIYAGNVSNETEIDQFNRRMLYNLSQEGGNQNNRMAMILKKIQLRPSIKVRLKKVVPRHSLKIPPESDKKVDFL